MALARSELTAFFLPYGKYPLSGFSTCVLCAKQAALPVSDSDPPIRSLLASGCSVPLIIQSQAVCGSALNCQPNGGRSVLGSNVCQYVCRLLLHQCNMRVVS
ncbi:hypothetical protein Tco_0405511 [Tanacetum coccineum]